MRRRFAVACALVALLMSPVSAQFNLAPTSCANGQTSQWTGSTWACVNTGFSVNTTSTASSQTAKQTLLSVALTAASMNVNGRCIRITGWGTAKATANNKTQTIDFGATTVATTGAVANNAGVWRVEALVCRTSATAQAAVGGGLSATTVAAPTNSTPAETLANAITIALTSTNVTDTDGTIAKGLVVEWVN